MSKITIVESGMKFGEYDAEDVFQIETSSQYIASLKSSGIKICEFILLHRDKLLFLEAKTRCPNFSEAKSSEEKLTKFNEYINSIVSKFKNSLNLYANILLGRYEKNGLSTKLNIDNFLKREIVFVLVVKNAQKDWLIPYLELLSRKLEEEMKVYKVKKVLVINEETARKYRIVQ